MKIVFLTEFFPIERGGKISGGAESRTYYLARELSQKNDVTVITAKLTGALTEESWGKLKIFRVGSEYSYTQTGKFWNRFIFFLAAIIKGLTTETDVIDANSVPTYLSTWIIGFIKNTKTVFWIPDVVGIKQAIGHFGLVVGFIEGFFELLSIYFFRADTTIALSETTKNKLLKLEYDTDNVKVIYPGI